MWCTKYIKQRSPKTRTHTHTRFSPWAPFLTVPRITVKLKEMTRHLGEVQNKRGEAMTGAVSRLCKLFILQGLAPSCGDSII